MDIKPRLIKKYANRRLYDTVESKHVTLSNLRELIVSGLDLQIIDDTSGEDITRALLLQIIVDREQAGQPLLTEVLLAQLIRFHGNPMQGMMADYLQRSVGIFLDQQQSVQSRFQSALSTTPVDTMRDLMKSNAAAWESLMGFGADTASDAPAEAAPRAPSATAEDTGRTRKADKDSDPS